MARIGFIGAGNMGLALAKAIRARIPDSELLACDVRPERMELLRRELPGVREVSGAAEAAAAEVLFLAVKPQDVPGVMAEIAGASALVISIAAGVRLATLEAALPAARVVRVMPNTPCLVGAMAAGYALGRGVSREDRALVERLLAAAGYAVALPEELLDAVTGLSGSGPAFVARLVEAFVEAGRRLGIPQEAARELSLATFEGTARLLRETGMSTEELVRMVSSPGGTTVAGREVLDPSDVREVLVGTIEAAARRSKELGR